MTRFDQLIAMASRADRLGVAVTRLGLIVVLLWIGGQKVTRFEADGIVPFVANSPFMSFSYAHPAPEYRAHMNREGEVVPANRAWHESNHTYLFAYGLGAVIVAYGLMIASHPWLPRLAAVGSFLVFVMSFVTLSFLVTTPECWVPDLGGPEHGFPLLAAPGSTGHQGRDHDGRRPGQHGRLGQDLPTDKDSAPRDGQRYSCNGTDGRAACLNRVDGLPRRNRIVVP